MLIRPTFAQTMGVMQRRLPAAGPPPASIARVARGSGYATNTSSFTVTIPNVTVSAGALLLVNSAQYHNWVGQSVSATWGGTPMPAVIYSLPLSWNYAACEFALLNAGAEATHDVVITATRVAAYGFMATAIEVQGVSGVVDVYASAYAASGTTWLTGTTGAVASADCFVHATIAGYLSNSVPEWSGGWLGDIDNLGYSISAVTAFGGLREGWTIEDAASGTRSGSHLVTKNTAWCGTISVWAP